MSAPSVQLQPARPAIALHSWGGAPACEHGFRGMHLSEEKLGHGSRQAACCRRNEHPAFQSPGAAPLLRRATASAACTLVPPCPASPRCRCWEQRGRSRASAFGATHTGRPLPRLHLRCCYSDEPSLVAPRSLLSDALSAGSRRAWLI